MADRHTTSGALRPSGDVRAHKVTPGERTAQDERAAALLGPMRPWVTVRYEDGALRGTLGAAVDYGERSAVASIDLPAEEHDALAEALEAVLVRHLDTLRRAARGAAVEAMTAAMRNGEEF
jgi:hypothetical protein